MSYFYLVNQESIQHFEIEFTDVANAVEHDYMIVNVWKCQTSLFTQ